MYVFGLGDTMYIVPFQLSNFTVDTRQSQLNSQGSECMCKYYAARNKLQKKITRQTRQSKTMSGQLFNNSAAQFSNDVRPFHPPGPGIHFNIRPKTSAQYQNVKQIQEVVAKVKSECDEKLKLLEKNIDDLKGKLDEAEKRNLQQGQELRETKQKLDDALQMVETLKAQKLAVLQNKLAKKSRKRKLEHKDFVPKIPKSDPDATANKFKDIIMAKLIIKNPTEESFASLSLMGPVDLLKKFEDSLLQANYENVETNHYTHGLNVISKEGTFENASGH